MTNEESKSVLSEMTFQQLEKKKLIAEITKIEEEIAKGKKQGGWFEKVISFLEGRIAIVITTITAAVTLAGLLISLNEQLEKQNILQLNEQMIGFINDLDENDVKKIERAQGYLVYFGKDAIPILLFRIEANTSPDLIPLRSTAAAINSIITFDIRAMDKFADIVEKRLLEITEQQLLMDRDNRTPQFFKNYIMLLDALDFPASNSSAKGKLIAAINDVRLSIKASLEKKKGKDSYDDLLDIDRSLCLLINKFSDKISICK
jgi:hypothetical protein